MPNNELDSALDFLTSVTTPSRNDWSATNFNAEVSGGIMTAPELRASPSPDESRTPTYQAPSREQRLRDQPALDLASAADFLSKATSGAEPLDYTIWRAGESADALPTFPREFKSRYPGADPKQYEPIYRKAVDISRVARQTIEDAASDPAKIDESRLLTVSDNDWPMALDILRNEAAKDYSRRKSRGDEEPTFDQLVTHIFRGVEQAVSPMERSLTALTEEFAPTAAMQQSAAAENRMARRRSEIAATIYAARPAGADSESTFKRGVLGAAESLPLMVSSALASIAAGPEMLIPGLLSRGGTAAFAVTAAQMVPKEIIDLKDDGYSTNEAIIGGTISGLTQAAIEGGIKIPGLPKIGTSNADLIFGRSIRGLLKKNLTEWMNTAGRELVRDYVGENLEEVLQDGTQIATRTLLSALGKSKVPYETGKAIEAAIAKIPETMVAVGALMAPGAVRTSIGGPDSSGIRVPPEFRYTPGSQTEARSADAPNLPTPAAEPGTPSQDATQKQTAAAGDARASGAVPETGGIATGQGNEQGAVSLPSVQELQTAAGVRSFVESFPEEARAIRDEIKDHPIPHTPELGVLADEFRGLKDSKSLRKEFGRLLRDVMDAPAVEPTQTAAQQETPSGETQEGPAVGTDEQGQEEGLLTPESQRVETPPAPESVPTSGAAAISDEERKYGGGRAAEARKAFDAEWKNAAVVFQSKLFSNPLDPELFVAATRLAVSYAKFQGARFADFVTEVMGRLGRPVTPFARNVLAAAWAEARKTNPEIDEPPAGEPTGPTGLRFADIDREREAAGLPPIVPVAQNDFPGNWDEALKRTDESQIAPYALVHEIIAKPRPTDDVENAMLLQEYMRARDQYNKAFAALVKARATGNAADIATNTTLVEQLAQYKGKVEEARKLSSSKIGASLNSLKMMANEDFSLASMTDQATVAKESTLTPEEQANVEALNKAIEETQKQIDSGEKLESENQRQADFDFAVDELKKEAKKPAKPKKARKATSTADTEAVAEDARAIALEVIRSGITDREKILDATLERMKKSLPDITRDQVMDAASLYGKFTPLDKEPAKVRLREVSSEWQQLAKLRDLEARIPLAKTGKERQALTDEARRLTKLVNEAKKKYGVVTTDPARQLKSTMDAIETRLRHEVADLDRQIAAGKRDIKQQTKIEYSDAAKALREHRDALKVTLDEIDPVAKPAITDAQRLAALEKSAERSIAYWSKKIENIHVIQERVKEAGAKPISVASEKLEAARNQREALKEEYAYLEELRNPKATPDQIANKALATRLTRSTADLYDRIARNDFAPKPKRAPRVLDKATQEARFENDKAKATFAAMLEKWRKANRSTPRKIFEESVEALSTSRAILASSDLSAVFRQGGFLTLSHPIIAARAFEPMLKAFASERGAFNAADSIARRPNADLYKRAKLSLTGVDGKITHQEEAWMSKWVKKIPVIAGSERAYVAFLNQIRADVFDSMVASLGRGGGVTDEEAKVIANYVNVATGRADFGKYNADAATLAKVFFAPRLVASRFELLAGQPLYGGNARTRKQIATEYARALTGLALLYITAQAALSAFRKKDDDDDKYIGLDPRSSDFGKIRIGNTRIDPLMGLSQATVLLSRLATGETVNSFGETKPLRESLRPLNAFREKPLSDKPGFSDATTADVVARFLRSKLAPIPGTVIDVLTGENVVGEKVTPAEVSQRLLVPLSFGDVYEAMKAQGVPAGSALGMLSILGMGVQSYESGSDLATHFLSADHKLDAEQWRKEYDAAIRYIEKGGEQYKTVDGEKKPAKEPLDVDAFKTKALMPLLSDLADKRPILNPSADLDKQIDKIDKWEKAHAAAVERLKDFDPNELRTIFYAAHRKATKSGEITPAAEEAWTRIRRLIQDAQ